jgi:hypothetical protein
MTTIFLRWDGIRFADATKDVNVPHWQNQYATCPTPPGPRRPIDSKTTTSAKPKRGPVLSAQRAEVTLASVGKVFAPMQEYCSIEISVKSIERAGCIVLQIRDLHGVLVYAERLTQRQIWGLAVAASGKPTTPPPLAWTQGEDAAKQQRRDRLRWVSPTDSAYHVSVWISDGVCGDPSETSQIALGQASESSPKRGPKVSAGSVTCPPGASAADKQRLASTEVRVHSISLAPVTWAELYRGVTRAPDLARPGGGKQQTQWVQYKLNELGFPAGPLTGVLDDDTQRAIRRFRQASSVLYQRPWEVSDDFEYVKAKPGAFDSLGAIDGPLLDELDKGVPKRTVTDVDPLAADAKIYVDQDRVYVAMDEMASEKRGAATTIKHDLEQAWLQRPLLPIKAVVAVEGAAGGAVIAPAAVEGVKVHWSWSSGGLAAGDGGAGALPTPSGGQPSQTKAYVERALARVGSELHVDHAPVVAGGLVDGTAADKRVVFRPLPESPFAITVVADEAETPAYALSADRPALAGGSVILFSPSTIAGDSYRIKAAVGPAQAESHRVTVWRRLKVAAHVSWPAMSGGEWETTYRDLHPGKTLDLAAMWNDVRREYQHAFVEVVGPVLRKQTSTFPATFPTMFEDAVKRASPARKGRLAKQDMFWDTVEKAGFEPSAYYPGAPAVVGLSEATPKAINDAIRDLLGAEIAAGPGDDPPQLKAFKKWVSDWAVKDENPPAGQAALSSLEKDALLVDASQHFLNDDVLWVEKTVGGVKYYLKPSDTVVGSIDLAPFPAPSPVPASQTTVDAINDRVRDLLATDLAARHRTDVVQDMPSVHLFSGLCGFRGATAAWNVKGDETLGVTQKNDPLLKLAAAHYKRELQRLAAFENLGPERKVLRYKAAIPALPAPYAPSRELSEKIAASQRESVTTPVNNLVKATQILVLGELEQSVFAETEPGIIILDFKPHAEIQLARADGLGTEPFLAKIFASANGNGLVVIDQAHLQIYKWVHLFAHELGHCLFLKHWKNAGGFEALDHDHADENCQMSYAAEKETAGKIVGEGTHYAQGRYAPHFCGKCNLKLRGWNLRAKAPDGKPLLPATSDDSKQAIVYVDPVFPHPKRTKAKLPSPTLLDEKGTELVAQLLGQGLDAAAKLWSAPPTHPGMFSVVANPKKAIRAGRAVMDWESLPLEADDGRPIVAGPSRTFDGSEKQAWIENIDYMSLLAGRTMANEKKIEFNGHFHWASSTDIIHEVWHLLQKMGGDAQLYEGPTDLFAGLLGRRMAMPYRYNPSYAEFVLSVVDQWLPALGATRLAELYVVGSDHFPAILNGSTAALSDQLMTSKAWQARGSFKVARPDGEPLRSDTRVLRSDLEQVIADAPADVAVDLRGTLHDFLDFLDGEVAKLTPAKRSVVDGLGGTERYYAIARLTRQLRKQHSHTLALRTIREFKRDADENNERMRGYDVYERYLTDELRTFNADPAEPHDEVADGSAADESYFR